jgi:hypothetical protein
MPEVRKTRPSDVPWRAPDDRPPSPFRSYLVVEGELQNMENVISVKAARIQALHVAEAAVPSHDFH